MAKAKTQTEVVISVEDTHLKSIKEVAKRLRAKGLVVKDVLENVGTITGSIEPGKIPSLTRLTGVAAVEESHSYQLPPPDSEIQ